VLINTVALYIVYDAPTEIAYSSSVRDIKHRLDLLLLLARYPPAPGYIFSCSRLDLLLVQARSPPAPG